MFYDATSPALNAFLVVGSGGIILRSTDGAKTFKKISSPVTSYLRGVACLSTICLTTGSGGAT